MEQILQGWGQALGRNRQGRKEGQDPQHPLGIPMDKGRHRTNHKNQGYAEGLDQ